MLGNTLTTTVKVTGEADHDIVTTRNSGESDDDFIDRHCRAILAYLKEHQIATNLIVEALGIKTAREEEETDESFVQRHDAEIKEAA